VGTFAHVVVFSRCLLLFCLSACFWLYADDIARRMFPGQQESSNIPFGMDHNFEALKHIAFVIAGILILNGAISALINPISSILAVPRQLTIYSKVYLAEAVIRIVLGTWLILGTEKLRGLPTRLRNLAKKIDSPC
jgi:predicted Co/Zn/Cd cation transporter (cation efflux family)